METVLLGIGIAITCSVSFFVGHIVGGKSTDKVVHSWITESLRFRATERPVATTSKLRIGILTEHEFRNWQQVQLFNEMKNGSIDRRDEPRVDNPCSSDRVGV